LASSWRALRHHNYRLFFTGQLISLMGTWMHSAAQSWLVYRLTGSSLLLGTLGFATQFPVFLLAPAGGVLADAKSRHRIVLWTQSLSMALAFALAALTLAGVVRVWHVVVVATLLGIVNAFDIPARQAFVNDMVGKEDLLNAIALNSTVFHGARIVGPAVAGFVISATSEGWCFFVNGLSFFAIIVALLMMRMSPATPPQPSGSALRNLLEGFEFVSHPGLVRSLLLLLGLVSIAGMPYAVLLPVFADRILHGGPRALGFLMGAAGIGALSGALRLATRSDASGLTRWVAFCAALCGASLVAFSHSRIFWLSAALLVPVGFSVTMQMVASNTVIQKLAPDALRGRVLAVYAMMFMGMQPVGALIGGALAQRIGAQSTVALGGIACLAGSALFALSALPRAASAEE
jgi:MFS family permease